MPGRKTLPEAFRSTKEPNLCACCGKASHVGDVRVKAPIWPALIWPAFEANICRPCLNDMSNAVDELFREEDRGPKEVKPC